MTATIKKSLLGIKIKAQKGYTIDGQQLLQLNESGSDFIIVRSNDERKVSIFIFPGPEVQIPAAMVNPAEEIYRKMIMIRPISMKMITRLNRRR